MKKSIIAPAVFAMIILTNSSEAAINITAFESGSDVTISYSGSVNTDGLTFSLDFTFNSQGGGFGDLSTHPSILYSVNGAAIDIYSGVSYDNILDVMYDFNQEAGVLDVGSDPLFINGGLGTISLPDGYVSGNLLSGTMTLFNTDLDDLGLTETTTVTWSWGSGMNEDSATFSVTQIPEPSSAALLGLGGLAIISRRRRA